MGTWVLGTWVLGTGYMGTGQIQLPRQSYRLSGYLAHIEKITFLRFDTNNHFASMNSVPCSTQCDDSGAALQ